MRCAARLPQAWRARSYRCVARSLRSLAMPVLSRRQRSSAQRADGDGQGTFNVWRRYPIATALPPATPPRMPRRVIVSLHDVAPPFEAAIREQIALLATVGVRRLVFKVVPNWHGAYPLHKATSCVALLREQVAAGSQLVLHGYEHQPHQRGDRSAASFAGPWLSRLRARLFAADAAEFLTLSEAEAEDALHRGLEIFARAALPPPRMFCAPGWLHNSAALMALERAGFHYLLDQFLVRDLRQHRRVVWTPGEGYMGASPRQEAGVQVLNMIMRQTALRVAPVAKVYLHPQRDPTGVIARRCVAELAAMMRRGWQPATYAEVCGDDEQ
jgi:predicted deacetylase